MGESSHRRLNPLTGEWVLVSPGRTGRPWQGKLDTPPAPVVAAYDPACYLCPGNERAGGVRNPQYTSTFVFDNDFPALRPDAPPLPRDPNSLCIAEAESGICRVICFSPRHDLSLPSLPPEAVTAVVQTWQEQSSKLLELPFIEYVQIFENRGATMGASNPHPHCQIWAVQHVPNDVAKEERGQIEYLEQRGTCLLCDYLAQERGGERIVTENNSFAVVVPFWAVWPFETLVLPKRHASELAELTPAEANDLGTLLSFLTRKYDTLFGVPFPYSMGFHQRPKNAPAAPWHIHAHFYPPLLRSAEIRKFMVGFELLAQPQRDITPEEAARILRNL